MLLGLLLSQSVAAGPAAQRVALGYDLYAASLPAASLDIDLERTGSAYRVTGDLRTLGLADMRVGWRVNQVTEGRLVDGRAAPARYINEGEYRDRPRVARMTYDKVGIDVELTPTPEAEKRPPVAADQRQDTVDFMSAMVSLAFADSPEAACSGTRRIFDGRRRYDMTLTAGRSEHLAATRFSAYQGPALHCQVTVRHIAGFPPQGDGVDIPKSIFMWLAREAKSGLVLPVRIQAATAYGTAIVHLARLAAADERQAARTE